MRFGSRKRIMQPLVLLSHSSINKEDARTLALLLITDEISVWFDEWEIQLGESVTGAVDDALERASHVILMWSKGASSSDWVTEERRAALTMAIQSGQPTIIVVLLDDEPLPPLLRDRRHLRWSGGTEEDRQELVDAVLGRPPSASLIRAVVRKYNEVITDTEADPSAPFNYAACPRCGSLDLNHRSATDYSHDRLYYFIDCGECGWGDWTE